jgi:PAS domain S-box-containing protein
MDDTKSSVRVLHLEDSPRDAEIIRDRLGADGLVCDVVHVNTREKFESALAGGNFDVILCDYNLPGYDGISALQAVRQKHPMTPVLLISGSLGEDEAVKCLQHGATDYLLKQKLERLPAAVKRALEEAEGHRQRQQAEAKLRESEERFQQLAAKSSEGFWFVAVNPLRILYVSPGLERIWGLPASKFYEDPGKLAVSIHSKDQSRVRDAWGACFAGRSSQFEIEYRVLRPDGSLRWVLDGGTPIRDESGEIVRVSGVVRDITERKLNESQMLRTQRLESIGTLASGVAHDVNNALAPILMATELLRMSFPDQATQNLELIHASAKRAADMMKQLLTFAKGVEGERLLLQPRHLLREMEKLMQGSFPKNIELRLSFARDLSTILGDATQLEQVLLNLCVNARDAMPAGGTLTLKAQNTEIDEVYASAVLDAKPGRYVEWQVTDTGTGIAPEILDRIFEPFFSTKGPEKGTGLGLSTVIGIVKSHGGFIRVHSTIGQGSTFAVYLPAVTSGTSDTSMLTREKVAFRGNGEAILVVDDEAPVREITRKVLTGLNFKVLLASDGAAALVQAGENSKSLRAVITDMHMPGMDGRAFVRVLKYMLPEAKIVVASGSLDEQQTSELKTLGVSAVLGKPFTQESLAATLKTLFTEPTLAGSANSQSGFRP